MTSRTTNCRYGMPPIRLSRRQRSLTPESLKAGSLNQFSYFVRNSSERNFAAVRFTAREGLGKLQRLVGCNLARERRFERIDHSLQDCGSGHAEEFFHNLAALARIFHSEPGSSAGVGHRREINRL